MPTFTKELESLINKHSLEGESNTPDFILAQYLKGCLNNFDTIIQARDRWYGTNQQETSTIVVGYPVANRDCNELTSLDDLLESEGILDHCTKEALDKLDQEVLDAVDKDKHYPLGEPSARKWAIAWRLTRDANNIDANGDRDTDIDGWMTTWFANCMASSPDNVKVI